MVTSSWSSRPQAQRDASSEPPQACARGLAALGYLRAGLNQGTQGFSKLGKPLGLWTCPPTASLITSF